MTAFRFAAAWLTSRYGITRNPVRWQCAVAWTFSVAVCISSAVTQWH